MNTPKEGIYLDATLAVIGEQVEERIEQLSRRRALRLRMGIAALALTAVASGSLAAVALTSRATDAASEASVALNVAGEITCVDGVDRARPAYFTARYRTAEAVEVDPARLCDTARSTIATDDGTITDAAPAELVAIAESLLTGAARDSADQDTSPAPTDVSVSEASFGLVSAFGGPQMIVCPTGTGTLVLAAPYGDEPTEAERAMSCAEAVE